MPYLNQILGTIISSALDYDNLCKITGDSTVIDNAKSSYVPCDGRSIVGSQLAAKANMQTAPDMRGRFMRGLNIIYSTGQPAIDPNTSDPDGNNRNIGSYQADSLASHKHQWKTGEGFDAGGGGSVYARNDTGYNVVLDTTNTGGEETRPRNVSVFFYLKIN